MGLFQSPNQLRFSYMTITEREKFMKWIQIYRNGGKNFIKEKPSCPAFDFSPIKTMTDNTGGSG